MIRLTLGVSALLLGVAVASAQTAPAPAAPATAAPAAAPAANAEGKTLFAGKTCIACHGRGGARSILNYPDLAGQDAKYLFAQMTDITEGKRVAGPDPRGYPRTQGMKDIMHLVTAPERQAIADYLAKEPPAKIRPLDPPIDDARRAAGKEAFLKGGCVSCHGQEGAKPLSSYPFLAGQKRDYLVLQLTEIRDGIRQNGRVATMRPFAKKLDDAKIALIADYLSQTERAPK